MELYVLDSLLRRTAVIDQFESLIWTERYTASGDFQLVIESTQANRRLFNSGLQLALNESDRVMTVEQVEDKSDTSGRSLLTVKGPSLEDLLNNRSSRTADQATTTGDISGWLITDTAPNIARTITDMVIGTRAPVADQLPYYSTVNTYPPTTIAEPTNNIVYTVPTQPLYSILTALATSNGFGFRIYRGADNSVLYFNIYTGTDRTRNQHQYTPVIFSEDLGTLQEVTKLTSISSYYNVAYVYAQNDNMIVYAYGADKVTGFQRRILPVEAKDITLPKGPDLNAAMQLRGSIELAKHQQIKALDGKAPQESLYRYGIDYNLGDLVELRSPEGDTELMRVTEQIFVSDPQGDRAYPTLVADEFITPGSWSATDSTLQWSTEPITSTWSAP